MLSHIIYSLFKESIDHYHSRAGNMAGVVQAGGLVCVLMIHDTHTVQELLNISLHRKLIAVNLLQSRLLFLDLKRETLFSNVFLWVFLTFFFK